MTIPEYERLIVARFMSLTDGARRIEKSENKCGKRNKFIESIQNEINDMNAKHGETIDKYSHLSESELLRIDEPKKTEPVIPVRDKSKRKTTDQNYFTALLEAKNRHENGFLPE